MFSYLTGGKVDQDAALKELIEVLPEWDREQAALSDHKYYQMKMSVRAGTPCATDDVIAEHREWVIKEICKRYLIDSKWKVKKAQTNIHDCLEFRHHEVGNFTRYCFYDTSGIEQQLECQKLLTRFMGPKPRVIHMDYDSEGRANVLLTGRYHFVESREDVQGWIGTCGWVFERAIAAMIRRAGPEKRDTFMCNVILDFHDFDNHKDTMPMFMAREMMRAVFLVHPGRVYNGILMDLNSLANFVLKMFRPLVEGVGCQKIMVIKGRDARVKLLGEHYLPENVDKLNVEEYYQRPFDYAMLEDLPTDEEVLKPSFNKYDDKIEEERAELKTWPIDMPPDLRKKYRMS